MNYDDESRATFLEQIETLEDALDNLQDTTDEYERLATNLFWDLHTHNTVLANKAWWEEPTLQELVPAQCFKDEPGECVGEIACIDGKKSQCAFWNQWTNCREMGYCTRKNK